MNGSIAALNSMNVLDSFLNLNRFEIENITVKLKFNIPENFFRSNIFFSCREHSNCLTSLEMLIKLAD